MTYACRQNKPHKATGAEYSLTDLLASHASSTHLCHSLLAALDVCEAHARSFRHHLLQAQPPSAWRNAPVLSYLGLAAKPTGSQLPAAASPSCRPCSVRGAKSESHPTCCEVRSGGFSQQETSSSTRHRARPGYLRVLFRGHHEAHGAPRGSRSRHGRHVDSADHNAAGGSHAHRDADQQQGAHGCCHTEASQQVPGCALPGHRGLDLALRKPGRSQERGRLTWGRVWPGQVVAGSACGSLACAQLPCWGVHHGSGAAVGTGGLLTMINLEVGQMCTQLLAELDSCICQGTGWGPAAGGIIIGSVPLRPWTEQSRAEQSKAQQCSAEHISTIQGTVQPRSMPAA